MTAVAGAWRATVAIRTPEPAWSDWLEQSLGPEAAREVPRARAVLRRRGADRIDLEIEAHDAGAMRAALNTYLGWVQLSVATLRAVGSAPRAPGADPR